MNDILLSMSPSGHCKDTYFKSISFFHQLKFQERKSEAGLQGWILLILKSLDLQAI